MKHNDNITFEKFSHKKPSTHKEKEHKQHWRQERKNVRENKRYMGEM